MSEYGEVAAADAYCRLLTRRHYENFLVVSGLPRASRLRRDLLRIYAYARTTDDLGDESGAAAIPRLERWRQEVGDLFKGRMPIHPVLVALRQTIEAHRLQPEPFLALIQANIQDQGVSSYATWEELRAYCMLSAAPVGRMVLRVFGLRDAAAERLSDDVCIGLQLANFAQDVSWDARKGRSYLLEWEVRSAGVAGAVHAHCERARRLLDSGLELETMVPSALRRQVRLYRLGGLEIIEAIERVDCRTDRLRPRVSTPKKLRLLLRTLLPFKRGGRRAVEFEAV
ncbi:MAG: squalene/phytoene synthase family protein [bacterium]|nr:squalene/phytoene synthase family protein [bacterium]